MRNTFLALLVAIPCAFCTETTQEPAPDKEYDCGDLFTSVPMTILSRSYDAISDYIASKQEEQPKTEHSR
jgi:hypothetical protein